MKEGEREAYTSSAAGDERHTIMRDGYLFFTQRLLGLLLLLSSNGREGGLMKWKERREGKNQPGMRMRDREKTHSALPSSSLSRGSDLIILSNETGVR